MNTETRTNVTVRDTNGTFVKGTTSLTREHIIFRKNSEQTIMVTLENGFLVEVHPSRVHFDPR